MQLSKMFSTKLGNYPRIIKFASKTCNYKNYDINLQNTSYLPLAYTYNLRNIYQERRVCAITNNVHYHSTVKNSPSILSYSTKPIEVPPIEIPPPSSSESNEFGTLGGLKYESVELDNEELKEEERLKNVAGVVPRKFKPSPGQYSKMIKNYIEKGDLQSAEEVLAECLRNRDKPSDYMYTLLIRAFAVQGDIKTCFQYYSDMRSRHFKIKANTYTSLFNACANSPDSFKALDYLRRAREHMAKQELPMNHAHYNCIVKAYGRHNKFEDANKLVQEMMDKKIKIGISTLNSLMYAANTNKESGLKYMLHIWQLMRKLGVPPDMFSYNLLLRAIRDTRFGDCKVSDILLPDKESPGILTDNNRPDLLLYPPVISPLPFDNIQRKDKKITALLKPPKSESLDTAQSKSSQNDSEILPTSIANIDLDAVLKQNKLILFGGIDGLLQKMKTDKIEPNIKTLTYLIELVPDSVAAETEIIRYAKAQNVRLDIDFYNMLIKKRSVRGSKKEAKAVLNDIHKAGLKPNIMTYGVLALACTTSNESRELLQAMKATGHTINKYVVDSLLSTAFINLDFLFILQLMEQIKYERVRLDEETYEKFDRFQQKMTELIKTKHRHTKSERFKIGFSRFNMRYKMWQEEMGRKIILERESKKT